MASTPQKSASTHRSAVIRGTHEFQIVGYSARKPFGHVVNVSSSIRDAVVPSHVVLLNLAAAVHASIHAPYNSNVKSGSFQVGGYTWNLVCTFDYKGHCHLQSITLELLSTNISVDVLAMASLRINDPLGQGPPAVWRSDAANTFSNKFNGMSWNLSLPDAFRGNEQRYVSAHDDRLTILCTVEVFKEDAAATAAEPTKCFVSTVPPPTIRGDFHNLLLFLEKNSETSDVTFVVEGTEILAHRVVLAMRSSVFAAELLGHMRESTTGRVTIHDMSASTFRAMLHFIYSDELPAKPSNIAASRCPRSLKQGYTARRREFMDLLVAADMYDLERLRLLCENILVESIDITTVMPTLLLVRGRQSCRQLEDSCIEYIASDPDVYAAVRATAYYKQLKETCNSFITEVSERLAIHSVGRHHPTPPSFSSSGTLRRPPEKSVSMFNSSEVVRGTHEFRIPNFSYVQRSHGIDQVITSNIFNVGGYDWMLNVYPSGYSTEKPGEYISVFLRLVTDPGNSYVKSSKRFRIDDPSGKSPSVVRGSDANFIEARKSLGFQRFITVKSAKSHYMGYDGSLTIHCDIDVTKEAYSTCTNTTTTAVGAMIVVPPPNIASHLEQLMISGQGSDVTFLVDENEIHAHSLIIAVRAPLLFEAAMASMHIDGMKATVFRALLHFVYTDELPHVDDVVVAGEILVAACRFRLERMTALCKNLLAQLISKDNALSVLELAWRHHCKELKLYCTEYISLAMK